MESSHIPCAIAGFRYPPAPKRTPVARPFEELAGLDRLIHEPARLAILTALSACDSADFLYLQRLTGLTKGNLSAHLAKLEKGGLVAADKAFIDRKPRTALRLTPDGRLAIELHWKRLDAAREETRGLRPEPGPGGASDATTRQGSD